MFELIGFGERGWGAQYASALLLVVELALTAFCFGFLLGLLGSWAKLSRWPVARGLAETYTTVIRGVPELLVIWIVFFGSSIGLQRLLALFGQDQYVEVNAFWSGVFALSLVFGAFATEVLRGAFLAVPHGQIEAAKACGMPPLLIFRRIHFPQMVRYAIPGLSNLWLVLLKDTSLISVVALDEVIRVSRIAGEATHQPFTFYFVAALLYLGLTVLSMTAQRPLERWADRGVRAS